MLFFYLYGVSLGQTSHTDNFKISTLSTKDGLANNTVADIIRDSYGFMWIATLDGLNRYDGYNFITYRNVINDTNSIIHNKVSHILEASDHKIWVGTRGGLCILDQAKGSFTKTYYRDIANTEILQKFVKSIEQDNKGNIWIGTLGKGLIKYTPGSNVGEIIHLETKKDRTTYEAKAISINTFGEIWIFVPGYGLCVYNPNKNVLQLRYPFDKDVTCIESLGRGQILLGTESGIYEFSTLQDSITAHYSVASNSLNSDLIQALSYKNGEIWVATDGGGINILDSTGKMIDVVSARGDGSGLLSDATYSLLIDNNNRKWVGTMRGGLSIIQPEQKNFWGLHENPIKQKGLANNFVLSLCEDKDGDLWIGTDGGGLSLWKRNINIFQNFTHSNTISSLSSNYVTSIVSDHINNIWLATYSGGINRFNKKTQTFKLYSCISSTGKNQKNVWVLYEDSRQLLWAGVFDGTLFTYDALQDKFITFNESLRNILSIYEDKDGTIWVGDQTSVSKLNTTDRSFIRYTVGAPVRAIYEDKAGNFWIGTEGLGLLSFNKKTGRYITYSSQNGITSNNIMRIVEDTADNLWISTFNGLNKFDIHKRQFTRYYEGEGIQSNEFSYNAGIATKNGELMFGNLKGVTIFNPAQLQKSSTSLTPKLTNILIDNIGIEKIPSINTGLALNELQEIIVPFNRSVTLSFASLNYDMLQQTKYSYYLKGIDKTWKTSDNSRTANYTHLQEGKYTFHVRSADANGRWSTEEKIFHIRVLPPWYRTWAAYILYTLAIFSVLYLYQRYKNRQTALKYEIDLAHKEAEKEKELKEKKIDFFTNVSHEFRAPLSLIVNPLKDILNNGDGYINTNELNIVYRNATRLLGLVDQLLLFQKTEITEQIKIQEINFPKICAEVFYCFTQQASSKNISYDLVLNNPDTHIYGDREKIEIILFNIISNALKYTPSNGKIKVEISETDKTVTASITDSGPGVPKDVGEKLFEKFYQVTGKNMITKKGFGIGLYLVKNYTDLHKAKVSYETGQWGGANFCITFKKGYDHFDQFPIINTPDEKSFLLQELTTTPIIETKVDLNKSKTVKPDLMNDMLDSETTILVVDDDPEIIRYLAKIFSIGFKVLESDNAAEAFQITKKFLPDIIISDVSMKEVNGIKFCQQIKGNDSTAHIPLILLTGTSSDELKLQGIKFGADDYINKPFDKDLLIARVHSLLKSKTTLQRYFFNEITLQEQTLKISEDDKLFLDNCIKIVEKYIDDENFNVKTLVKEAGMSHSNLYQKVKAISGQSISGFIRFIRLRKAAELLINSSSNVNEIAFQVGFSDLKYFRIQFNKLFGINPSEYIKKHRKPFKKKFSVNEKLIKNKNPDT